MPARQSKMLGLLKLRQEVRPPIRALRCQVAVVARVGAIPRSTGRGLSGAEPEGGPTASRHLPELTYEALLEIGS
jgi:hypothetical protein